MAERPPKRLLSHVIAEWACALKYEDLSPAAIQAAKLFWFDSIGCALGGSQQDDAKILLKHYRAMSAMADSSDGKGSATAFVSGFKTNPVDAAFLNGHMIRAMDYNDIYWKADPCHPSDLIAAPRIGYRTLNTATPASVTTRKNTGLSHPQPPPTRGRFWLSTHSLTG